MEKVADAFHSPRGSGPKKNRACVTRATHPDGHMDAITPPEMADKLPSLISAAGPDILDQRKCWPRDSAARLERLTTESMTINAPCPN